MIDWRDVARYFIAVANATGDLMTNLRLQKLVYYAQAWHLALYDQPLMAGTFKAWVHGPVLPELYQQFKMYGSSPIREERYSDDWLTEFQESVHPDTIELLDDVAETYMGFTAFELERMTHREAPWLEAREGLSPDAHRPIREETMKTYYRQLLNDSHDTH
ncbi:type II toxin-antitoxin system antitoxin SocA domain-containing protein [Sulfobacillus harzensis]|uniref:type II toxin-antitoxin system antitoxin SocA domain-containing protein n=1 Tax=Sulfobacillus harzensis TaxID=2729629 RepID=UPI001A9C00AB